MPLSYKREVSFQRSAIRIRKKFVNAWWKNHACLTIESYSIYYSMSLSWRRAAIQKNTRFGMTLIQLHLPLSRILSEWSNCFSVATELWANLILRETPLRPSCGFLSRRKKMRESKDLHASTTCLVLLHGSWIQILPLHRNCVQACGLRFLRYISISLAFLALLSYGVSGPWSMLLLGWHSCAWFCQLPSKLLHCPHKSEVHC